MPLKSPDSYPKIIGKHPGIIHVLTESAGTSNPSTRLQECLGGFTKELRIKLIHIFQKAAMSDTIDPFGPIPPQAFGVKMPTWPVQRSVQKLHRFWNRIYEGLRKKQGRDAENNELLMKILRVCVCIYIYIVQWLVVYVIISVSVEWQNADTRPRHLFTPVNLPGWSCTVGTSFAFAVNNVISILGRSSLWLSFQKPKGLSVHHWSSLDRNPTLVVERMSSKRKWFQSLAKIKHWNPFKQTWLWELHFLHHFFYL